MANLFETNILASHGERGRQWLNDLPSLVNQLAQQWDLTELHVLPQLSHHYLLRGWQAERPIIIKLGFDSSSLSQEAAALTAFANGSIVKLLAQHEHALLLERLLPGNSLRDSFAQQDEDALTITAQIIQKLHQAPLFEGFAFPTLANWLAILDQDWDLPLMYLTKARELRDALLATATPPVLLHGDLHQENILQHGNDWRAIDPKGVIGEAIYEVVAFISNPRLALSQHPQAKEIILNRINKFSQYFTVSEQRINQWCFVQSIVSWCWALQDNTVDPSFAQLAAIFFDRGLGT